MRHVHIFEEVDAGLDQCVEVWRPAAEDDRYEVSSRGRVRSWAAHGPSGDQPRRSDAPRILKPHVDSVGYPAVHLGRVHRLVAAAFLGDCPDGYEVRHLDGDPSNNFVTNLAYGTRSENNGDTVRHGTHHNAVKTHCARGHAYDEANTYWNRRGFRQCRACQRDSEARYRARRREREVAR